jgi:tellurium resistance protein TerD
VGLGWDPNESTGYDFDLDASAIMINSQRKLLSDNHFIFYNNLCGLGHDNPNQCKNNNCSPGQFGLLHTGDDPDGKSSDGDDDEAIEIDLSKVPQDVQEILFVVTIAEFEARKQNFGQVRNSYIRIVDNSNNQEIAKYELDEDFSIETGIEFGRLYKRHGEWKFEASGIGYKADLGFFLEKYYNGTIIK